MHGVVFERESLLRKLEGVIAQVRAVVAARIVLDASDNVETIHVLATRDRTAEQITADIEAVCAAMFNLHIDRRRVRISQPDEPESHAPGDELARLELHNLSIESGSHTCRVVVKLRCGDALYEGMNVGPDVVSMRPRLAALAALEAVRQFQDERARGEGLHDRRAHGEPIHDRRAHGEPIDGERTHDESTNNTSHGGACPAEDRTTVSLHDLHELTVGPWQALAASLLVSEGIFHRTEERWLIGCALVQKDPPDGAVRAVLDAVNRHLFYNGARW